MNWKKIAFLGLAGLTLAALGAFLGDESDTDDSYDYDDDYDCDDDDDDY